MPGWWARELGSVLRLQGDPPHPPPPAAASVAWPRAWSASSGSPGPRAGLHLLALIGPGSSSRPCAFQLRHPGDPTCCAFRSIAPAAAALGRSADRRAVPPRSSLRHCPAAGRGRAGDASPGQRAQNPVSLDPAAVRGLLDQGYSVQDAATGAKTDRPLIEVPSTVDVLQPAAARRPAAPDPARSAPVGARRVGQERPERLRPLHDSRLLSPGIRCFLDGAPDRSPVLDQPGSASGVERDTRVLEGRRSVLYGQIAPGGVVNLVSKRPHFERHYDLGLTVGNHDFYEGTFDLGGSLNADKTVAVRVDRTLPRPRRLRRLRR